VTAAEAGSCSFGNSSTYANLQSILEVEKEKELKKRKKIYKFSVIVYSNQYGNSSNNKRAMTTATAH